MITVTRANTIIRRCNLSNIPKSIHTNFTIQYYFNIHTSFLQSPFRRRFSENIQQIYRTSIPKSMPKFAFCHGCSPVNVPYIFRTPIPKYTSEGLLLVLPFSGMNYPLIHGIKISFLLLHCYTLLGMSKTNYYIIYYILLYYIL